MDIKDIYSTRGYIIEWLPKHEVRPVTGSFIKGHFNKCRILDGPFQFLVNAEKILAKDRDKYDQMLDNN